MIRNIVFDLMGVLILFDSASYRDSFQLNLFDMPSLIRMLRSEEWRFCDLGVHDGIREILPKIADKYRASERVIKALNAPSDMLYKRIDDMADYLLSLKERGYHIYLLSNVSAQVIRELAFMDIFHAADGALYSYEEGIMKPDQRIFEDFLKRYALKAEECLFIDDSRRNTAAAASVGLEAIQHKKTAETIRQTEILLKKQ